MREGWEIKKLRNVGTIFNGNSINAKIKKEKYLNTSDGLPFIATKDIGFNSDIDYDNGVRIPSKERHLFKVAPENSVLICAPSTSASVIITTL